MDQNKRFPARIAIAALLAAGSVALDGCVVVARPAYAGPVVTVAPPPLIVEQQPPPPAPGYVWFAGYWNWEGGRHVWHRGYWAQGRAGYRWVPHHWVQGPRGGWHMVEGHWER
jgi:hypothetical protein